MSEYESCGDFQRALYATRRLKLSNFVMFLVELCAVFMITKFFFSENRCASLAPSPLVKGCLLSARQKCVASTFLPCYAMLAQYILWLCVRLPVCHKSEFYGNG